MTPLLRARECEHSFSRRHSSKLARTKKKNKRQQKLKKPSRGGDTTDHFTRYFIRFSLPKTEHANYKAQKASLRLLFC